MSRRTYISGPITGLPGLNRQAFLMAEYDLEVMGLVPINPCRNGLPVDTAWADHMRADLKLLVECDRIYMLRGWQLSRGARLEHHIADQLRMAIMYEPPATWGAA